MEDIFEFMVSSRGMALINAIACVYFAVLMLLSISRQTIDLGSLPPKIRKSDNPRAYWSIIFLEGAIVLWTGAAAVLNFLKGSA